MNREGNINKNIKNISPNYIRPTKDMLDKYEKFWLPLRKASKSNKVFLIYGDFNIIDFDNDDIFLNDSKKSNNSSNSNKSNKSNSSKKGIKLNRPKTRSNKKSKNQSSKTQKNTQLIKGKKRTWLLQ